MLLALIGLIVLLLAILVPRFAGAGGLNGQIEGMTVSANRLLATYRHLSFQFCL